MKSMWFYIRKKSNKTQQDIADEFGVSRQYICKIESGKDKMPINFQIYYLKLRNSDEDKIIIEYLERELKKWII